MYHSPAFPFHDPSKAETRLYGMGLSNEGSAAFRCLWDRHSLDAERVLLLSILDVPESEIDRQRAHIPVVSDCWARRTHLVRWLDAVLASSCGGDRDPRDDRMHDDLRADFRSNPNCPLMETPSPEPADVDFDWERDGPSF